ncbi:glycosyltransferase [bacterium]|nr:MAG: glycosyltransferase [bacterium]
MRFSIVIPAHNEEENIGEVLVKVEGSLVDLDYELIVVNDHSIDKTGEIVKEMARRYQNIRLIENNLDKGFANAIQTGLRSIKTDVVIPVMGDLCDDLTSIKLMLAKIEEGYDIVCGSRYSKGGERSGGSKFKGFLSSAAGRSLHFLLGIPTNDIANAFKMYRKKVIDSVKIEARGFDISMEIPVKAYYMGFKITEVPTVWHERTKGKSTFNIFKLLPGYLKLYIWAIFKRITTLGRK